MVKLRIIAASFLLAVVAQLLLQHSPAHAEVVMTQELTERVRTHCIENQASLNRLHQTDAFLRNDRGDLYRTISDKLMVPLNRRLVDNQLDGSMMIATTADYNQMYTKFYDAYIAYDNALTDLQKIDCTKEPVTFYTSLLDARKKRKELSTKNQSLIRIISKYGTQVTDFRKSFGKERP